ncbi:MAG: hypothetical protein ACQEV6_18265 [Pseudomonadota bacterium]
MIKNTLATYLPLLITVVGWLVIYSISVTNAKRSELRQICNRIDSELYGILGELKEGWLTNKENRPLRNFSENNILGRIEKLKCLNSEFEKYTGKSILENNALYELINAIFDMPEWKSRREIPDKNLGEYDQSLNEKSIQVMEKINDIFEQVESGFSGHTTKGITGFIRRNLDIISGIFVSLLLIISQVLVPIITKGK